MWPPPKGLGLGLAALGRPGYMNLGHAEALARNYDVAAMERHWRANVAPAVLLAQALHEHLAARDATGCVVNLLDQKLWNLNPDFFSYTLSKAALQAATVMLAQSLAPRLRVCGVAPGVTLASAVTTGLRFSSCWTNPTRRRSAQLPCARWPSAMSRRSWTA